MKSLVLLLLFVPVTVAAQEQGVRFERGSSWQEIQAKAKATSEYLLVAVCTSRACETMDTSVFQQARVGDAINSRFVAVKLGADAPALREYKIATFPTFLFFAPDGRLVHRAAGERDVEGFLALAADALDPAKQYYVQLERYERGIKDYGVLAYLARTARALNDTVVARRIAWDYIDHLSAEERYTTENIRFIARFTERSSDPGFAMFYAHADTIDQIMGTKGYAQVIADRVITVEEITPLVFPSGQPATAPPDWAAIAAAITRKYGSTYADRTVLDAQMGWNRAVKKWPELIRYTLRKLEQYGSSLDSDDINGLTWDLFLYSDNRQVLATGIAWMEPVAKSVEQNPATAGFFGPAYIDTYANLLYKVGRTAEAIAWEEKAVQLSPRDSFLSQDHTRVLAKMRKGEPTWPQEQR